MFLRRLLAATTTLGLALSVNSQWSDEALAVVKLSLENNDGDVLHDCSPGVEELWSKPCKVFSFPQRASFTRDCDPKSTSNGIFGRSCGACRVITTSEIYCYEAEDDGTCAQDAMTYSICPQLNSPFELPEPTTDAPVTSRPLTRPPAFTTPAPIEVPQVTPVPSTTEEPVETTEEPEVTEEPPVVTDAPTDSATTEEPETTTEEPVTDAPAATISLPTPRPSTRPTTTFTSTTEPQSPSVTNTPGITGSSTSNDAGGGSSTTTAAVDDNDGVAYTADNSSGTSPLVFVSIFGAVAAIAAFAGVIKRKADKKFEDDDLELNVDSVTSNWKSQSSFSEDGETAAVESVTSTWDTESSAKSSITERISKATQRVFSSKIFGLGPGLDMFRITEVSETASSASGISASGSQVWRPSAFGSHSSQVDLNSDSVVSIPMSEASSTGSYDSVDSSAAGSTIYSSILPSAICSPVAEDSTECTL